MEGFGFDYEQIACFNEQEELHNIFEDSIDSGNAHLGVQKRAPEISKGALDGTDPIARCPITRTHARGPA